MEYITQNLKKVEDKLNTPPEVTKIIFDVLIGHGYALATDGDKYVYVLDNEGVVSAEKIDVNELNRESLGDYFEEVIYCCNTEVNDDILQVLTFASDLIENYVYDMENANELNFADTRAILLSDINWDIIQAYISEISEPETVRCISFNHPSDDCITINANERLTTVYQFGMSGYQDWIESHIEAIDNNQVTMTVESSISEFNQGYEVNVFVKFSKDLNRYLFINERSDTQGEYSEYIQKTLDNFPGKLNTVNKGIVYNTSYEFQPALAK